MSLNSVLFKKQTEISSIYTNDLCGSYLLAENQLLNETIFHIEYEQLEPKTPYIQLDKLTGIVKLVQQPVETFKIHIGARLYYKTQSLKINFKSASFIFYLNEDFNQLNVVTSSQFYTKMTKATNNSIDKIQIKLNSSIQTNETILTFSSKSRIEFDLVYCSDKQCPFYLNNGTIIATKALVQHSFKSVDLIIKQTTTLRVKYSIRK